MTDVRYEKVVRHEGFGSWSGEVLVHDSRPSQFPRPLMSITREDGFGSFTLRGLCRKLDKAIRRDIASRP